MKMKKEPITLNNTSDLFTNIFARYTVLFILCFLMAQFAAGQTDHDGDSHESAVGHHHISAFGGFTTNYKGKQGYKLGLEYEYRLSELMGVGSTFDFTGNDFEIFALSVGTSFYPFEFPLIPAVGVGAKSYDGKWNPFVRTLLTYDFHLNHISIGPMVMYDLFPKNKNIMSFGVTVGIGI